MVVFCHNTRAEQVKNKSYISLVFHSLRFFWWWWLWWWGFLVVIIVQILSTNIWERYM